MITSQDIEQSLIDAGFDVISATTGVVTFWYNGNIITYYVKKQWASGKGIEDGRGWGNLWKQIKPSSIKCCPKCGCKL